MSKQYRISDRGYHGEFLVDADTGHEVGRIQSGLYCTEVRDVLNRKVGEIGRETMCGGVFDVFRPAPSPFGGSPSPFGR